MRANIKKYEDFKLLISGSNRKILNSLIIYHQDSNAFADNLVKISTHRSQQYSRQGFLFGVMVSKKLGKANKRNYFKRLVRACLKLNEKNLPQGKALIIMPNVKNSDKITHSTMNDDIKYFCKFLLKS